MSEKNGVFPALKNPPVKRKQWESFWSYCDFITNRVRKTVWLCEIGGGENLEQLWSEASTSGYSLHRWFCIWKISGKLSILRNRNLANVFYRLGLVEIFGTGITRIKQLYAESLIKPEFEVSENAIKIVLPIFETNVNLTEDEKVIYKFLSKTMLKPISEIAPYVPFGKSKTTQLLKAMEKKGVIAVEGKGRGTKYIIKWLRT